MSHWTVGTLRAKCAENYKHAEYDSNETYPAFTDLVATVDNDHRISSWQTDSPHIYVYFHNASSKWSLAESALDDYAEIIRDAVIVSANDTTDRGTARYYEVSEGRARHIDTYDETSGRHVGQYAITVLGARHEILARDPFHEWTGELDDAYLDEGTNRL